jgi:PhzF family phenazine biosynthesis protein
MSIFPSHSPVKSVGLSDAISVDTQTIEANASFVMFFICESIVILHPGWFDIRALFEPLKRAKTELFYVKCILFCVNFTLQTILPVSRPQRVLAYIHQQEKIRIMKIPIYQLDAFAESVFKGNPAAVCQLKEWLPDSVLQNIAMENNLSETAYFTVGTNGNHIRWFTPKKEVKLCGHATLATAYVFFELYGDNSVCFESLSGTLSVQCQSKNRLTLDFPSRPGTSLDAIEKIGQAIGLMPIDCLACGEDYLAIFENEKAISSILPRFDKISELDCRGLIVSAKGYDCDFVSRFFAPKFGVNEDPVTGSAHCALAPYWSEKLNKPTLTGIQLSERGGRIDCTMVNDRVHLSGQVVPYLKGEIEI